MIEARKLHGTLPPGRRKAQLCAGLRLLKWKALGALMRGQGDLMRERERERERERKRERE